MEQQIVMTEAAKALSKRGASHGGKARAAAMTPFIK